VIDTNHRYPGVGAMAGFAQLSDGNVVRRLPARPHRARVGVASRTLRWRTCKQAARMARVTGRHGVCAFQPEPGCEVIKR